MVIRVLTLAVRLYGNMLAGHMVLAVFSLATTIFLQTAIFQMDIVAGLPAIAWFFLLFFMYALETLVAFLPGIRIHHSFFFLHRHGNQSSLIGRNSFRLAPLAAQAA